MVVPSRFFAFLLAAILAVHAVYGVVGGVAILCLGGGHKHAPTEVEHCESACGHDAAWLQPVPGEDHEERCGCTDVELSIVDLLSLPRSDDGGESSSTSAFASVSSDLSTDFEPVLIRTSLQPPSFDFGVERRLAVVASVRLTI